MPRFEILRDIHGCPFRVVTDDPVLDAAATETLAGFSPYPEAARLPLEISLHAADHIDDVPLCPSESAVPVRQMPTDGVTVSCAIVKDGAGWFMDFGGAGRFFLDLASQNVEGWLVRPGRLALDWAASFVLLAVIELLRTQGLYAVHAAALETGGRGILLVGTSGSGKTTSCLSLACAGFGCLSDDHPILKAENGSFALLPFPGRMAVTEQTAAWFPETEAAKETFRKDTRKTSFDPERLPGFCPGKACKPAALFFPRISDWPETVVEKLPAPRALESLLPQTLLVLDPVLAERQFRVMADLVRQTPAYRLHFGEDVRKLPEIITRLLMDL